MVQKKWTKIVKGMSEQIGPSIASPESSSASERLKSLTKRLKDMAEEGQQIRRGLVIRTRKTQTNDTGI